MGQTLKTGGRELEHRVLEAVKEKIADRGYEVEIRREELANGEIEILTAWFLKFGEHRDSVLGEFLFRDNPMDPDGGRIFSVVLTMDSQMPLECIPTLSCALSILNFYIETGSFAINKPADLLVYRNTRTLSGDAPEEAVVKDCTRDMEQSYQIALKYCTVVLALSEGSLSLEEFMDLLYTGRNERDEQG